MVRRCNADVVSVDSGHGGCGQGALSHIDPGQIRQAGAMAGGRVIDIKRVLRDEARQPQRRQNDVRPLSHLAAGGE